MAKKKGLSYTELSWFCLHDSNFTLKDHPKRRHANLEMVPQKFEPPGWPFLDVIYECSLYKNLSWMQFCDTFKCFMGLCLPSPPKKKISRLAYEWMCRIPAASQKTLNPWYQMMIVDITWNFKYIFWLKKKPISYILFFVVRLCLGGKSLWSVVGSAGTVCWPFASELNALLSA